MILRNSCTHTTPDRIVRAACTYLFTLARFLRATRALSARPRRDKVMPQRRRKACFLILWRGMEWQ